MGNQAVQKQIISQVLEQSEKITCLNKTESAWHDTNLIGTKEEGPLVIKQLLKFGGTGDNSQTKKRKVEEKYARLQAQMSHIHQAIDSEKHHPNVMSYYKQSPVQIQQGVKDVTLLLRQYVCYNLSEKLIHIPQLLTPIEKKWLIFQLLCAIEQVHSVPGLTHGDIKPDNILVTSYDWLYLADMHPYKPVVVMDDNLKRYNKYFGYLDNNIRCYLAPERWLTPPQTLQDSSDTKMAPSMDIFSAGCVITEILSDGEPLFDLPRLQNYRRGGGLDLREELIKRIEDDRMVDLLMKMLARDPNSRPSAQECIQEWCGQIFPDSFKNVFFQLGSAFQRLSYLYSDNRIALIRFHIDAIFKTCFGVEDAIVSQKFSEPLEPSMYRLCSDDATISRFDKLIPTEFSFINFNAGDDAAEAQRKAAMSKEEKEYWEQEKRDSALMVVHWIGQLYTTCFYPQMRIVALEMLQKISVYLPFETRLGQVLPYVAKIFDITATEQSAAQAVHSQVRVRVKAFEVLLSLFDDLIERTDVIIIEPFDFKVFQNYILPIVKKQMDQSRGDPLLRYTLAKNLAKLARVGTRLIEVAQGSAIRLRQEIRDKREQMRKDGIRDSIDFGALASRQGSTMDVANLQHSFAMMQRRTMVQNRVASTAEGLLANAAMMANQMPNQNQHAQDAILEDIVVPNYDQELAGLWSEIQRFIESFSGEEHDSNALIAMLANLTDLSQIFGAEKGDFLIQQCISPINRSDYQVKVQVLKTLSSLCLRIGQQRVAANVLPLTEIVLEDPEDIVVIHAIKMLIQLVKLRLLNKQQSLKMLESLLPLMLHPNKQIRFQVGTYISILANPAEEKAPAMVEEAKGEAGKNEPRHIVINKAPLFSQEEFYCFVRPKLLIYAADQSEEMLDIKSAKDILSKLRPPLSLSTMRAYFQQLSSADTPEVTAQKEENFQKTHEMSDSDTFAFAFLSDYFKERLRKIHTYQKQKIAANLSNKAKKQSQSATQSAGANNPFALQKQSRNSDKVYRCLKASALAHLTKLDLLDTIKQVNSKQAAKVNGAAREESSSFTKDTKANFVRKYQESVTQLFDPQTQLLKSKYQTDNFGLNPSVVERDDEEVKTFDEDEFITPEMQRVLLALNEVPLTVHSDTLNYLQASRYGQTGVTQGFHVNADLTLTAQKAQPSLISHFDVNMKESFRLTEDHVREWKIQKMPQLPVIRPQGLLVTTLYEHKNPVNTVTVSDDQKYFLTGSREDKTVHVWKVQNIEEDVTSRSTHSIHSQGNSCINQITMINRTKSVAIAGSGGIQIHDLERSMQHSSSSLASHESPRSSRKRPNDEYVTKIDLKDADDEVTRCFNMLLPNSNGSHILFASTQKGGFLMHDLRSKSNVRFDQDFFGCQRGAVTSMCMGADPYQLTMGTLGGYIMVYDVRYNEIATMFHHNMHYPILAMSTYKKGDERGAPLTLISAGGPQHELAALNLETGIVETLFRCAVPSKDRELCKTDCPIVPEYIRETNFKDNRFGTVRRETTLKQFSRQLHSVKNHDVFTDIQSAIQSKLIKNIDSQLTDISTRQRFKLLHDACKSPNACRSILVPRHPVQRIMHDNVTAQYAITGGNDMKIRYWSLTDSSKQSYQINTPRDDEAVYMSERMRDTTVIQERILAQKDLPAMTASRVADTQSTAQSGYYQKQGVSQFVKFAENTAYHNAIANQWNKQVMLDQHNRLPVASPETQALMQRFQYEKQDGNSITVQTMNGVSPGQFMNNLGILTNGQDNAGGASSAGVMGAAASAAGVGATASVDLVTEQTSRNSEIVAHADTILDLALVNTATIGGAHDVATQSQLLVSCSRDSTVKVWRC